MSDMEKRRLFLCTWSAVSYDGVSLLVSESGLHSFDICWYWSKNESTYQHNIQHTHPFNGPFSGTTRVGQYQKGKTNLDFTEARDSE